MPSGGNPHPKPLLKHLGDLPERFASHRLDRMRCTWRMTFEPQCNWKLLLENAMETYHTGIVHRNSVGAQRQRPIETRGDWLCMQVVSDRSIATLPGSEPPFEPIEGLDEDARQGTYFSVILPSCQFAVAQDSMWWLNVTPVAHDRSRLEVGGCFPEDVVVRALEDMGILERQQRALTSVLYRPGPLSHRDDMVQALGRWVIEHRAD